MVISFLTRAAAQGAVLSDKERIKFRKCLFNLFKVVGGAVFIRKGRGGYYRVYKRHTAGVRPLIIAGIVFADKGDIAKAVSRACGGIGKRAAGNAARVHIPQYVDRLF